MTSTTGGEVLVFGGRIRARAGNGIVGAKIEILRGNTRTVLASSISIEGGSYLIRVSRASIDSHETFTIRALSGSGKSLVARSTRVKANVTVTDLVVPPARLKNFQSAAQFLPRVAGSRWWPIRVVAGSHRKYYPVF